MKVLCEPNENIATLWGKGKPKKDTTYRLLSYVVQTATEKGVLLHNVVTGQLILLDKDEVEQLCLLPCTYDLWMDELIASRFLVPAQLDDKQTVDSLRKVGRQLYYAKTKGTNYYVIFPTTHCCANCFYCFEHGKENFALQNMSDATADLLVEFIERNQCERPIRINWFGGEPLLGIHQIDRICEALRARGIDFSGEMVSNGFLFTQEIVQRTKNDWCIDKVQITLDGTEEVYNSVKDYRKSDGVSPFRKVLGNIDLLIEQGITVLIVLNVGLHNLDDLAVLADQLIERFPNKDHIWLTFNILYEDCGSDPHTYSDEEYARLQALVSELQHRLSVFRQSFDSEKEMPCLELIHCMADGAYGVAITPAGKITKCLHYVSDHFVGDLYDQNLDSKSTNAQDMYFKGIEEEIRLFREQKEYPQCGTCPIYPACLDLKMCEKNNRCREADQQEKIAQYSDRVKRSAEAFFDTQKER